MCKTNKNPGFFITSCQQKVKNACRLQDNTEANIWTFAFWSLDSNYGSKWGRKIIADEYSCWIHVSSVLQYSIF